MAVLRDDRAHRLDDGPEHFVSITELVGETVRAAALEALRRTAKGRTDPETPEVAARSLALIAATG